jgi:hypothetical protein
VQTVPFEPSAPIPFVIIIGAGVVILASFGVIRYLGGIRYRKWKKKKPKSTSPEKSGETDVKQESEES